MSAQSPGCRFRSGAGFRLAALFLCFVLCIVQSACSHSGAASSTSNATAAQPGAAVAGYIFDSRLQGIRPVTGTLGAAHLEGPLGSVSLSAATPCPSGTFGLGSDSAGGIYSIALPSGQPTRLSEPVSKDQRILLSPFCTHALVFSQSTGVALLVAGLPASPQIQSFRLPAGVAGAAIGDTGTLLYGQNKPDGSISLQIISSATSPSAIGSVQKLGGLAFVTDSDSAVIADSAANTISIGRQLSSAPTFTTLATATQGVTTPRAVAASADGHYAFVVNGAANTLLRIDLESHTGLVSVGCHCQATELLPLTGNASFQLTDPSAGTIFALQGDGASPRILFIPTDTVTAARGGVE